MRAEVGTLKLFLGHRMFEKSTIQVTPQIISMG
jgi:hypothetical protein